MVRKIFNGEYLKRVDNMTAVERSEYLSRVGGWLSVDGQCLVKKGEVFEARLQNVLQVSVGWNDEECAAFEEGAVLLSALVGVADTKLPELLYAISAKRSIKRMFQALWEIEQTLSQPLPIGRGVDSSAANGWRMQAGAAKEAVLPDTDAPGTAAGRGGGTDGRGGKTDGRGGGTDGRTAVLVGKQQGATGKTPAANATGTVAKQGAAQLPLFGEGAVPVRPKHIDQYVHLLPKGTQERAARVQGLYDELDVSREKLRLLMNDPTANAADRAAWATKVTKCDNALRKIFDELNAEWENLVKEGRVVVDDLGMARVLPSPASTDADARGAAAELGGETAEHSDADEGSELSSEEKAKRRSIRKWLTDTRNGNGNEEQRKKHVWKWKEHFREYLTLEGDAAYEDGKILEAAEHYGIDKGWLAASAIDENTNT